MAIQSSLEDRLWETWNSKNRTEDVKHETYLLKQPELQSDRDRVYEAICNSSNGITCKELAQMWGCTPNEISGRFTELRDMGFIVADGKRYLPNSRGRMYPHTIWRARI